MAFKTTLLSLALLSAMTSMALASPEGSNEAAQTYSLKASTTNATNVYWGDSHLHTGLSLDAEGDIARRSMNSTSVVGNSIASPPL